jgi:hypothetical protein
VPPEIGIYLRGSHAGNQLAASASAGSTRAAVINVRGSLESKAKINGAKTWRKTIGTGELAFHSGFAGRASAPAAVRHRRVGKWLSSRASPGGGRKYVRAGVPGTSLNVLQHEP